MNFKMILAALVALTTATAAQADPKLKIGCTTTTDCSSAMVAVDEGIFKRLGVDAEMVVIGINSNIPAALLSDSIQIGGPTSPTFLQAVDGGLDLVAVAGASVMHESTGNHTAAAYARNGVDIKQPKDFVGKKVGAPGFGAFLHVMFVKWLSDNGVDPKSVNFVEVSIPTQGDALKSGSIDVGLTGEPWVTRMNNAGVGKVASYYVTELKRTEPVIFYAASRAWAEKNPELVKKFREAIAEGAKIVNSDHEKAAQAISKFTKQPLDIVRANKVSYQQPEIKGNDFAWYVDFMTKMKLLQGNVDLTKLVLK
ncbi:ABC transporter substrate-binding protein [Rhodopseudomonas sp. HC1]|uniref:ABC transporter substrate-binding protein n=1 Tax=Rhodopseudomonas infernalis TaxID=2897386 RepID=UPI001EE7B53E|nr:ABC transporter substrate-binding protein [Rhodopseudomonas infernalis]MCG6203504.1 ABC transporter substrate-binding protein [Rhodopseudomonas infernalis]